MNDEEEFDHDLWDSVVCKARKDGEFVFSVDDIPWVEKMTGVTSLGSREWFTGVTLYGIPVRIEEEADGRQTQGEA